MGWSLTNVILHVSKQWQMFIRLITIYKSFTLRFINMKR